MATEKVLQLRLDQIRRDGGTQSRARLCSETVQRYAEARQEGAVFPPLVVFYGEDERRQEEGNHYWLASGFHRWHSLEAIGAKTAEVIVREGSRRDAVLYSVGENSKPTLHRTNEDKNHAVRLLLEDEEWWERTNVWIAEQCHVSDDLVAVVRERMEAEWKLAEEESASLSVTESEKPIRRGRGNRSRKGRSKHGGTRTINTTNIGNGAKKGFRERPAYPIDPKKDPVAYADKVKQIARSAKKYARQSLEAGWSWEETVNFLREARERIPVEN